MRAIPLLAVLCLLCFNDLVSQQREPTGCLQAGPVTECRTFLVTEFGAYYRLDGAYFYERPYLLIGNLGIMVNLGAHDAVGVLGYLSAHGAVSSLGDFLPDIGGGVAVRYGRWLSPDWRIDLTAGIPLPFSDRVAGQVEYPSAILEVKGMWRDYFGAAVRWEPTRYEYQVSVDAGFPRTGDKGWPATAAPATVLLTKHQLYVGAELGRVPGALTAVLGCILIALKWVDNAST